MYLIRVVLILFFTFYNFGVLEAQIVIRGYVTDEETSDSLRYVSIGIPNKDIGTVSDDNGKFTLKIENQIENDSLKFSSIGYESKSFSLAKLNNNTFYNISLKRADISLSEIVVLPRKEDSIGNNFKGKLRIGFRENKKGFECGILIKNNSPLIIEALKCNIAECTYDYIHFRVNVYKHNGENDFENILKEPIEIKQRVDINTRQLNIDLSDYKILVDSNTLITLEYIEDLGKGRLFFHAGLFKGNETYSRKTSQGKWKKAKAKLGFYVKVLSE